VLEGGRSVMKSTPRCEYGRLGMGSGWSLPVGRCSGGQNTKFWWTARQSGDGGIGGGGFEDH